MLTLRGKCRWQPSGQGTVRGDHSPADRDEWCEILLEGAGACRHCEIIKNNENSAILH